jgi:hypothetical protein
VMTLPEDEITRWPSAARSMVAPFRTIVLKSGVS